MGVDGVLYVVADGAIVLHDTRRRFREDVHVAADDFKPRRLAVHPSGGMMVLAQDGELARLHGLPFPDRPAAYAPRVFRPCQENPDAPRLTRQDKTYLTPGERAVAIAVSPVGRVAVLTWLDRAARVHCWTDADGFESPRVLEQITHPHACAWLSDERLAVLTQAPPINTAEVENAKAQPINEAFIYDIVDAPSLIPAGDFYPLVDYDNAPFVHNLSLPPLYATRAGVQPLVRLSLPSFSTSGTAFNARVFDSGAADTVWHRLYVEAVIPPGGGFCVKLAASNGAGVDEQTKTWQPGAAIDWHEHRFGHVPGTPTVGTPQAAWVRTPSEVPFHSGLLRCPSEPGRAGLFTVLIQRAGRRVRSLQGRYLLVRVELSGDVRRTPEIAALRAYGSRFSYVDRYLPELYHEDVFGADADEKDVSTRADFLERWTSTFESILTPLEDRIEHAYLMTDSRVVPEEALEWLGSWIGLGFDAAYPAARRRALLEAAPSLFVTHGTVSGLASALEVATGGAVTGGEIVILEDFRLRRTFATILGADLADEHDPLMAGLSVSGNSYVGDTLILGDELRKEFLAVFAADLPESRAEQQAIAALFDSLAHRVTIFVHQEIEPQDLGLIRRVVDLETPAHVVARVVTATEPFLVGVSSLVGIDTYLARKPERQPVHVGSWLGVRDYLINPAALDPRFSGGGADSLVAGIDAPREIERGRSFVLDGSRSRAPAGRRIARYRWKRDS